MLHVAALILGCPTVGPPPTRGLSPVVGWVYGDDGTTMPTDSVQKATWEAFGEASAADAEPDGVTRIVGSRVPKVLRTPRPDDLVDEARE